MGRIDIGRVVILPGRMDKDTWGIVGGEVQKTWGNYRKVTIWNLVHLFGTGNSHVSLCYS